MKLSLSILISLCLLSGTSFAAETKSGKQKSNPSRDSSEAARDNKNGGLLFQPFGTGPSGGSEKALIAALFLNPNSIVQLEFSFGPSTSNSFLGNAFSVTSPSLGIHFKKFLGNSFYVKAGADYRFVNYSYTNSNGVNEGFKGQALNGSVALGNQWQWNSFTLGCDWIGYSTPVFSEVLTENYASNSAIDQDSLNRSKKDMLEKSVAQGLRLYFGYNF